MTLLPAGPPVRLKAGEISMRVMPRASPMILALLILEERLKERQAEEGWPPPGEDITEVALTLLVAAELVSTARPAQRTPGKASRAPRSQDEAQRSGEVSFVLGPRTTTDTVVERATAASSGEAGAASGEGDIAGGGRTAGARRRCISPSQAAPPRCLLHGGAPAAARAGASGSCALATSLTRRSTSRRPAMDG